MTESQPWVMRVSELRQWEYCRRVVYYRYVMPAPYRESYKMQAARRVEEAEQALERRRTGRRFGLRDFVRRFDLSLESEKLGLIGRVDLLLEGDNEVWPVEVKDTANGVRANHVIQLAAYALLVEERFEKACREGFVYLPQRRCVEAVTLGAVERERVHKAMAEMREAIEREELPTATTNRSKCRDCEYRNYCGDVF